MGAKALLDQQVPGVARIVVDIAGHRVVRVVAQPLEDSRHPGAGAECVGRDQFVALVFGRLVGRGGPGGAAHLGQPEVVVVKFIGIVYGEGALLVGHQA